MNCPTFLGRVRARVLSHLLSVPMIGALAAIAAAPACVTSPYDGAEVGVYEYFEVAGFAETPSASVRIEAYNWATGAWESLGNTTSTATPSYPADYWLNSPALYGYSRQVRVANPLVPATMNRWKGIGNGVRDARLRVRNLGTGQVFYAGEYSSITCFLQDIAGHDFYDTAYACGFEHQEFEVYAM